MKYVKTAIAIALLLVVLAVPMSAGFFLPSGIPQSMKFRAALKAAS